MGYKLKRIMMRPNGVEKQVYPYRTFTIQRTEKSDMSSGWTYSDDAAGLTAGSTAFDDFFGYYGARLSSAGVETDTVQQSTPGTLDITQLGTLTSGDNVMIAFPRRGIKMSKSGSVVTLSITNNPNATGFQYYAFQTGTLTNPGTTKPKFYLGTYKSYNDSGTLKSLSGKTPTVNQTQANFCTLAKANGSGYNIIGFYQREYINALYMMKYGNPNSQGVVGMGNVNGSSMVNTGGTNSQTSATYGTSSATTQVKLFGLEDRWGNIWERVGGFYTDSSKVLYTMLSGWSGTTSGGESTGTTISSGSYNTISSVAGNNKAMFAPLNTVFATDFTQYYRDATGISASSLGGGGGRWTAKYSSGALQLDCNLATNNAGANHSTRIMYLEGLS